MKKVTAELYRLRRAGRPQFRVPPMPWAADAACQSHDPEQWMDDQPGRPTAAAKAVCAVCPVRTACLAHALAYDEPWGVWGGLPTGERVAYRLGLPPTDDDEDQPFMGALGPRKTKPPSRRAS
jgi:WhiB family transcriptional regulator, redox-sensing transcriptional regulator